MVWSQYRKANPVPTKLLSNGLDTAPPRCERLSSYYVGKAGVRGAVGGGGGAGRCGPNCHPYCCKLMFIAGSDALVNRLIVSLLNTQLHPGPARGGVCVCVCVEQRGRNPSAVQFNPFRASCYLGLYGVRHVVKDQSDSERGNLLPPNELLFPISSKGSFICIQDNTYHGLCYTSRVALAGTRNRSMGPP